MTAFVHVGRRWINMAHVDIVSSDDQAPEQPNVMLHFASQRTLALKDADAREVFNILGDTTNLRQDNSR